MSDAKDDIFPTARRPARRPQAPDAAAPSPVPGPAPAPPPAPTAPPPPADRTHAVLEFGSFREFIDDYSPYISPTGMFLLGSTAGPGDEIAFEVRLSDDFRLIHGVGAVEWAVPPGTPGRPAGVALRFTELDEPSRRLVARLVDNHRGAGGTPFDIDDRPAAAAPGAPAATPPAGEPGLPLSADVGTETIALPTSLAGLAAAERAAAAAADSAGASEAVEPTGPPFAGPPVAEPPVVGPPAARPQPPTAGPIEPPTRPAAPPPGEPRVPLVEDDLLAPELPAPDAEIEIELIDDEEPPPVITRRAEPSRRQAGAPRSAPGHGAEPAPAEEADATPPVVPREEEIALPPVHLDEPAVPGPPGDPPFDAAKTQIVSLPEDLMKPPAEAELPVIEAAAEPADAAAELDLRDIEALTDRGFEPAEPPPLAAPSAAGALGELLPEMPLAEAVAESPPAGEDAFEPVPPEQLGGPEAAGRPVPDGEPPMIVEMPDEEDLVTDYYRTSGPRRRGRAGLWIGLCLLAVVLGAATWRFKDLWWGFLPPSITGVPTGTVAAAPATGSQTEAGSTGPAAGAPPAADIAPSGEAGTASGLPPTDTGREPGGEDAAGDPSPPDAGAPSGRPADAADPSAAGPPTAEPPAASGSAVPTTAPAGAEPAGEAVGAEAPAPGAPRPSQVTNLSSRVVGDVTEVLIATDAALSADGFTIVRVAQPPARQVIKIFGPDTPYPREAVAVGTEHVRRLRTGFHRRDGGSEVHIVADLTGPGVALRGTEIRGSTLIVRFGSR